MTEAARKPNLSLRYEDAISKMVAFVGETDSIRPLVRRQEEFLDTLSALSVQRKNLEGALLIVILGGTGVGKSMLINALAGEEIATVSAIRPCTTATTFYSHRDNDLGPLGGVVSGDDRVVVHETEGLRRKILVDPPDFDSMLAANRRKLLTVLKVADLVLCVADPQKYRNLSLFRLLRRFHKGRSFLFVMNKADFGVSDAVMDDFRLALTQAEIPDPRLFLVSAKEAFEAPGAGRGGAFDGLQEVIRSEMDRTAIDRIKGSNLTALLTHVYSSIKLTWPKDLEEGLGRVEALAGEELDDAADRVTGEVVQALFEDEQKIRSFLLSAGSLSIGGIFGLYLAVAEKVGSLFVSRLDRSRAQDPVELRAAVRRAMEGADSARVQRILDHVSGRVIERLDALGVETRCKALSDLPPPPSAKDLLARMTTQVQERMGGFVEAAASGFGRNLAYNLLPIAYVVYFAWVAVVRLSRGELLDLNFFLSFVGLLGLLCFLQHVLAERGFRRRGGTFMRTMERGLQSLGREILETGYLPALGRFTGALRDRIRAFREIGRIL